MKIVVIGASGLIGPKLVAELDERGHQAVAASPDTGVNTLTGEGLADVLARASVVVAVSVAPSFEDGAALEFFDTSTRNLLAAEAAAGVGHHVALSVVGTERLTASGYLLAKLAQEELIKESSIPYSIVRATQFSDDVARALGRLSVGPPLNGIVEIADGDRSQWPGLSPEATRAAPRSEPSRRDTAEVPSSPGPRPARPAR
jgi:uncharacterized protein YbjT (DUF2867 family)